MRCTGVQSFRNFLKTLDSGFRRNDEMPLFFLFCECITFEDTRFAYGEQRFVTIGLLDDVVIIVHTETTEEIRIISMRRASRHEQKLYFNNLQG